MNSFNPMRLAAQDLMLIKSVGRAVNMKILPDRYMQTQVSAPSVSQRFRTDRAILRTHKFQAKIIRRGDTLEEALLDEGMYPSLSSRGKLRGRLAAGFIWRH